ncbi:MAG: hypothetical protein EB117_13030 [Betaproteobacteria bacterium]|nr:hypothetical protein [Betaproteobacteria bacterium]
MAAFVNTSRSVLLATAWTGTAPGLPGTQTVSGTLASAQDISAYVRSGNPSVKAAMQDGTTFSSGGFVVQYPGLRSGDDITFECLSDFAASTLYPIVQTTLGGLGSLVYLDLKPTSSARSATNASFVAAAYISAWTPVTGAVGDLAAASLTLTITGKFDYLTA